MQSFIKNTYIHTKSKPNLKNKFNFILTSKKLFTFASEIHISNS